MSNPSSDTLLPPKPKTVGAVRNPADDGQCQQNDNQPVRPQPGSDDELGDEVGQEV